MKRKEEVQCLIDALSAMPSKENDARRQVLELNMTEKQVFDEYVKNIGMEDRDENVYYAARDAARYLAGQLEATDIVPGIKFPDERNVMPEDTIMKFKNFSALITRINMLEKNQTRLEKKIIRLQKALKLKIEEEKINEGGPIGSDLVTIAAAAKFLHKGISTIYTRIKNKTLKTETISGRMYIRLSDISKNSNEEINK